MIRRLPATKRKTGQMTAIRKKQTTMTGNLPERRKIWKNQRRHPKRRKVRIRRNRLLKKNRLILMKKISMIRKRKKMKRTRIMTNTRTNTPALPAGMMRTEKDRNREIRIQIRGNPKMRAAEMVPEAVIREKIRNRRRKKAPTGIRTFRLTA